MRGLSAAAAAIALAFATPAGAFCMYKGELYAKTTLAQEFADSRYVVRAKVVSATRFASDEGDSWVSYRLSTLEIFKGAPPKDFVFFSYRNSGGFYLDNRDGEPDLGGEHLLFLVPQPRNPSLPKEAWGSMWVNYACGQSRPWAEVSPGARRDLSILAARARIRSR